MISVASNRCFQNIHSLFNHFISINRSFTDKKWNILFFGTDKFSLSSLERVHNEYKTGNMINKLEVVTNLIPGRHNEVTKYATRNDLHLHPWPIHPSEDKIFDLGIVVSFGHLIPKKIIEKFPLGILNVHASLLPRWRGAAPIIHTLMNGDPKTGVTIMRIHPHHFDVGDIINQKEFIIDDDILQPELHDALANIGAEALLECLHNLPDCLNNAKKQDSTLATTARKITSAFGKIKWEEKSAKEIFNLSRALCGIHPMVTKFRDHIIKIQNMQLFKSDEPDKGSVHLPGYFIYDKDNSAIRVWCKDGGSVFFNSIGIPGKRNMSALEFRNGYMKKLPNNKLYFTNV